MLQHSLSPEIGVHGMPMDNFSRSGSGGVNLSQLSVGLDLTEPANSNWSSTTSIRVKVWMKPFPAVIYFSWFETLLLKVF